MYHTTHIQQRYCDTDMLGHINNTAITQWLEIGRVDLEQYLPGRADVLLRKLEVDYVAEIFYPLSAILRTGVDRIGKTSVTLYQEIWQADKCCVTSKGVEVWFCPQTRRPIHIPEQIRQAYTSLYFGPERFAG